MQEFVLWPLDEEEWVESLSDFVEVVELLEAEVPEVKVKNRHLKDVSCKWTRGRSASSQMHKQVRTRARRATDKQLESL